MANGGTGGLLANAWTKVGPGTVTNTPGYLSIISDGLNYTSAYQQASVTKGKLHRFSYTGEGFSLSRKLGATQEGGEYLTHGTGVLGTQEHMFTPTTGSVWVQFQRLSNNTAIANDLRLVNLEPANGSARTLSGTNQYLYQTNQSYPGFSRLNANFFLGAWWQITTLPATNSGFYIYDFGNTATATTGGTGRVRLTLSNVSGQLRLVASNMALTGAYREEYIASPPIVAATPVFLGVGVQGNGHPYPVVGTQRGGGTITGSLPTIVNDLGQELRIGANSRTAPAAGTYANGRVWDAFWTVGSIPSDTVLNSIAGGQRPHQVSGFIPSFHWPMAGLTATSDEESITGLSTLRQSGSPGVIAPPVVVEPEVSAQLGWMVI
jgi:hypothetical protein